MTLLAELPLDVGPSLLPLDAGEQYRFTFAMDSCIGCHSCEVACAEQNDLPVGVAWRRVGEIEGGEYPHTRRYSLSMACNHCIEPACLIGCPTDAYVKLANGIVAQRADECIGCGYCTWNCPYEVPVIHPGRKIATKCDMCSPRLDAGELPACVLACPTHAIGVEKVDVEEWRAHHESADGPNLPPSSITISTTRLYLPDDLPLQTFGASDHAVRPQEPHWPLVFLTLLTQVAVGTLAATVLVEAGGRSPDLTNGGAIAAAAAGILALAASVLHLGRPFLAYKALRAWRRSWLSREVALFGLFAALSMAYAASRWVAPARLPSGAVAGLVGCAGIYSSARIYLVPARPAWNSSRTVVAFFLTALVLGPLVTSAASASHGWERPLLALAAFGLVGQILLLVAHIAGLAAHTELEYRGSLHLLVHRFRGLFAVRIGAATLALIAISWGLAAGHRPLVLLALGAALAGELTGRYLFYVTVVSMNMPGSFFRGRR